MQGQFWLSCICAPSTTRYEVSLRGQGRSRLTERRIVGLWSSASLLPSAMTTWMPLSHCSWLWSDLKSARRQRSRLPVQSFSWRFQACIQPGRSLAPWPCAWAPVRSARCHHLLRCSWLPAFWMSGSTTCATSAMAPVALETATLASVNESARPARAAGVGESSSEILCARRPLRAICKPRSTG